MKRLLAGFCGLLLAAGQALACSGDCGGDGEVTVDELIVGVNIALGTANLGQCQALDSSADGEVTVDELIAAVGQALNGCAMSVAGDYSSALTLETGHYGIVNLNVNNSNQITGSVVLTTAPPARAFKRSLSFNFPVGGVSVALSGSYDALAGGFEVSGSFVDGAGQTIPVVISGSSGGLAGSETVNLYLGSDVFPITLDAGTFATPTPTPIITPTPPPGGARLVYAAQFDGIYVINPDGSGKKRIIQPTVGVVAAPAWSPDGSKIAYAAPDADNHYVVIATANADGSNIHLLADNAFLDGNPAWSPDGSKIIFTAGGGDHIDVMNADGANRHRLVSKQAGEAYGHMSWSPDGSRVVFESTRPRQAGSTDRLEIWVMNADGSNLVQLTTNELPDRHPDWSPDGQKIIFARDNSFQGGIMSINPNGSGETRLIFDAFGASAPSWGNDGQSIAYSGLLGLSITNASGSNKMAVPGTQSISDFDYR